MKTSTNGISQMHKIKFYFTSLFILLFMACSSPDVLIKRKTMLIEPEYHKYAFPTNNTVATCQVGESMITNGINYQRRSISINENIFHKGPDKWIFYITIPKGNLLEIGKANNETGSGALFESESSVIFSITPNDPGIKIHGGLFIPDRPDEPVEVYWYPLEETRGKTSTFGDLIPNFHLDNRMYGTATVWTSDSFRYELIYSGKQEQSIILLYREYTNDQIRPAFTQEARYDLLQGNVIAFKNWKFKIISANNESIQYIVLQNSTIPR